MTWSIATTLCSGESGAPVPPISVRTQPGEIAMHVKPSFASSAAIARVSWFSAALDAR